MRVCEYRKINSEENLGELERACEQRNEETKSSNVRGSAEENGGKREACGQFSRLEMLVARVATSVVGRRVAVDGATLCLKGKEKKGHSAELSRTVRVVAVR